ncbi:hypothetical protein Tco_0772805 [Tanacetum coccineum]|uniref:Uncharacterized protein n=1 Tax=Tanacetum coccineum TaxID=301880 RepID=A0ABQ4ZIX8_9ASTR
MHVQEDNVEEEVKSSRLTTMGDITFDQLMDEYEKKKGVAEVEYESPYNTESVIKFAMSFPVSIIFGSLFIDQDMMGDTADLFLQDQLVEEEVDSDLKSMPDDEVKSFSGFEAAESINEENDTVETKERMHDLLVDALKNLLSYIIEDSIQQALPKFDQRVQKTLKAYVLIAIRAKVGKFFRKGVGKDMHIVKDSLSYYATQLDKGDVSLRALVNLMKDMVFLLDSAKVFEKAKAEGEKVSLKKDMEIKLAEEAKAAEKAKANA